MEFEIRNTGIEIALGPKSQSTYLKQGHLEKEHEGRHAESQGILLPRTESVFLDSVSR